MKGVNAPIAVRTVFLNGGGDLSGTVTGHDPDAAALFFRQAAKESVQNGFPMTGSSPDNSIGIMIHNDGNVLVPLLVACLVYADAYKIVQPAASVRFNLIECTGYAVPHGLPVNTHVL